MNQVKVMVNKAPIRDKVKAWYVAINNMWQEGCGKEWYEITVLPLLLKALKEEDPKVKITFNLSQEGRLESLFFQWSDHTKDRPSKVDIGDLMFDF